MSVVTRTNRIPTYEKGASEDDALVDNVKDYYLSSEDLSYFLLEFSNKYHRHEDASFKIKKLKEALQGKLLTGDQAFLILEELFVSNNMHGPRSYEDMASGLVLLYPNAKSPDNYFKEIRSSIRPNFFMMRFYLSYIRNGINAYRKINEGKVTGYVSPFYIISLITNILMSGYLIL